MIASSELILNPEGSIYHLKLKPEQIAKDIIFVGDQNRVEKVTKHFDKIEFSQQNREFKTQTGTYKGKRISVISTGIGPDNIDIVLNEVDALFNLDFQTRKIKENLTSLNIVRIGTSGAIQEEITTDSFVMSRYGIGLDNLLRSYLEENVSEYELEISFQNHTNWESNKGAPYAFEASNDLVGHFMGSHLTQGITITSGGFYGPQGRVLRLPIQDADLNNKLSTFEFNNFKTTNLEMETAAIYGLGKLLQHRCLSLNAIVANRTTGEFSSDPEKTINNLIDYTLQRYSEL